MAGECDVIAVHTGEVGVNCVESAVPKLPNVPRHPRGES